MKDICQVLYLYEKLYVSASHEVINILIIYVTNAYMEANSLTAAGVHTWTDFLKSTLLFFNSTNNPLAEKNFKRQLM